MRSARRAVAGQARLSPVGRMCAAGAREERDLDRGSRLGRVLVTGGAGFIGSELVQQLARLGADVTIVDNLANGKRENVDDVLGTCVRLERCDIRELERMNDLLAGVDVLFHLACLGVRHSIHSPRENHEVYATATLDLLQLAHRRGVGRFVHVSSSEVYGTARWTPMDEDYPPSPATIYGASKLAGECYARAYHRTYGLATVVVRPFNAYGPRCHHEGDSGEVIPKFLLRALAGRPMVIFGDGTQTRDFTFVSDTARGILAAGISESTVGETINLGQGSEITVNDLARLVAEVAGVPDAPVEHIASRPGDVLRLRADTTKAETMLGFRPEVTLREGLERLKAWYLAQGTRPEELLKQEIVRNWHDSDGGRDA